MILRSGFQVIRETWFSKKGSSLQNSGSKELWLIGVDVSGDSLQFGGGDS